MVYILKNDRLTVKIDTLGAEVISAVGADGFEYIWSGKEWGDHAPLLFPTCGRLKDGKYTYRGKEYSMKSHGFAKFSEFKAEKHTDEYIRLTLISSDVTCAIYPFDFKLTAEYRLDGNRLLADFTVENTGSDTLPYMFGWHPGFNMEGDAPLDRFYLDFGKKDSLGLYPLQNGPFVSPKREVFPLRGGRYYVNNTEIARIDTYILVDTDGFTTLASDSADRSVRLTWSKNLPYFCVWKAPEEEARFLCLEPWSNVPADGVTPECFDDREMSRLPAGGSEKYSYVAELK